MALRERWKNSVKVDEKKAETFLEKVKKRILRLILGEKAVSRSMKGKGDPAFEKRMKVIEFSADVLHDHGRRRQYSFAGRDVTAPCGGQAGPRVPQGVQGGRAARFARPGKTGSVAGRDGCR